MRTGIYIDVPYVSANGGRGMRFDVLRRLIEDTDTHLVRLNAYVTHDSERAKRDDRYRQGTDDFYRILKDFGFKVIKSEVYLYYDHEDVMYQHSVHEMRLGIDVLDDAQHLDRIILITGEGEFSALVPKLQARGCRVELIGFKNVDLPLREVVDSFQSGYLIPGLIPIRGGDRDSKWGEEGSFVRGICYDYKPGKDFGFGRFAKELSSDYWITDTRQSYSPYEIVFFHERQLNAAGINTKYLPSRDIILEFQLRKREDGWCADKIKFIYDYGYNTEEEVSDTENEEYVAS